MPDPLPPSDYDPTPPESRVRRRVPAPFFTAASALGLALLLAGCDDILGSRGNGDLLSDLQCSIPESEIFDGGVGLDGIPALTNPEFVPVGDPSLGYLDSGGPRVIGFVVDGQPYAVPHNILWWHEIVNVDFPDGTQLAATYCPLTGSSLVFDRSSVGGAEFGVSGLIFQNNLILYDRSARVSLFPQMKRGGRCGPADGVTLDMFPAVDMNWWRWRQLHPGTLVVTGDIGMGRDYRRYPYGTYEQDRRLLFPQSVPGPDEELRPMKERVLGVPGPEGTGGGLAFPFGELQGLAEANLAATQTQLHGDELLVLWDSNAQGAMAFRPHTTDGNPVTITVVDGRFVDAETGSEWTVDGRAVSGDMEGAGLAAVPKAYTAFWFAWEAFHPETEVWSP